MKPVGDKVLACPNECVVLTYVTGNPPETCPHCGEPMSWVQPHIHGYEDDHITMSQRMVLEQQADTFGTLLDILASTEQMLSKAFEDGTDQDVWDAVDQSLTDMRSVLNVYHGFYAG